jgi:succinate dehydrogenase/fumarate reductase flavoprotein subunit
MPEFVQPTTVHGIIEACANLLEETYGPLPAADVVRSMKRVMTNDRTYPRYHNSIGAILEEIEQQQKRYDEMVAEAAAKLKC